MDGTSSKSKTDERIAASDSAPKNHFDYLKLVKAPRTFGVYANDGDAFKFAIFGRDSLVVAEDILTYNQDLTKEIIFALAKLQGYRRDQTSEEEPGKIHHEYRAETFNNLKAPESSLEILHSLQKIWGGVGTKQVTYYGAHDPTLLYVRLIGNYVRRYGREILGERYTGRDGEVHTIAYSVKLAVEWTVAKLDSSPLGLMEYKRLNPTGIPNQAWKDSKYAYVTANGQLPNFDAGIASIELQGYTYDALEAAAYLLPESRLDTRRWLELARIVQEKTLELLWMEDQQFFAQALFYDSEGKHQLIDSLTSNGGLILDSKLIYSLPEQKRQYYTEAIAKKLFSMEFITDVGIRSRALRHVQLPGSTEHHGSYTVWAKETNAISRGLRRSGMNALARQLENRLINSVLMTSNFYQFYYVEINGVVWYDVDKAISDLSERIPGIIPPRPEPHQAWTISGAIRTSSVKLLRHGVGSSRFEKDALKGIPNIELITNSSKILS
jgi:glycogen debranching enzyme